MLNGICSAWSSRRRPKLEYPLETSTNRATIARAKPVTPPAITPNTKELATNDPAFSRLASRSDMSFVRAPETPKSPAIPNSEATAIAEAQIP